MTQYDEERQELVDALRDRGISDETILQAMLAVERHLFVRDAFKPMAYKDTCLPLAVGQTISQPYTVALMTQELKVKSGASVLEIGTGSGYQAAILAHLGCTVYTIERQMDLFLTARATLKNAGYKVQCMYGDGTIGWSEFAPYDGIIVTAGAPDIPRTLLGQMAEGGRMVVPVGERESQNLVILQKNGDQIDRREITGFKFVPLIGKSGWAK